MKKVFKMSALIQQALTSPEYSNCKKGVANYVPLVQAGSELLDTFLTSYVKNELKQEEYWYFFVGEALRNETLADVFDELQKLYDGLVIRVGEGVKVATGGPTARMKAQVTRALLFATLPAQDELHKDILELAKSKISTEETFTLKMMKLITNEKGVGSRLDSFCKLEVDGKPHKKIFRITLDYNNIQSVAIGYSKQKAKERACEKWFQKSTEMTT